MAVSAVTVRAADTKDFRALSGVLARAFDDDPVTCWFYPKDASRGRLARRFFGIRLRHLGAQGQIHTTDDLAGAALWALPGLWREEGIDALRYLPTVPALLPRLRQCVRGMQRIEEHHPPGPHLYLSVIGIEPTQQGRGIGTALLHPGLEHADREQLGCYLESSKATNVPFYERHGFHVREEIRLPGGPPLWLMWRDPR